MRRARISIKPNVRPGGRAVAPTAESKTSQESAAVDNTQQTQPREKTDTPSASQQSHLEVKGPAVATGDGNIPGCPSEKASVNISDRVPSSATTPTALQRRSRISATPNLARPKVRSVPPASTGTNASLPSEPSKSSPEPPIPAATSRDDSQNSTLSDSILKQTNATINSPPSSPSHGRSFQNTSPSSTQLQQELCHTPKKSRSGAQEAVSRSSSLLSPCIKLSRCYGPGSPLKDSEMSDKQRVLRSLKLKELMKRERRKELMTRKSGRRMCEHSDEVDLSKMTLADFIYYLPESNPMKSSLSMEEAPAETVVPPSPKVLPKLPEPEEEEDEDDDDLMVPKVKVAEDGVLILDEDSLTVRVQRTSDTVVEDGTPLFERGSTTTYMSFRKRYHVKSWSVRETDMFYLAISMVGTDFSLVAQLLTHRSRAEIKNKFKKEEKTNAWRVDKAFKNKRPFDNEFFSFLLKKVLENDQKRGKSIKLVVKPNKENKGKGGEKRKKHEDQDIDDDIQDEVDIGDNDSLDLEKENEDGNNVKVSDVTSSTSKKRKRKRESEPKGSSGEKTCKRKKKKKSPKGEESNSLQVEDESVNAENEDPSLSTISKKKRRRSRKGEEKSCEELEDKRKTKRNKKTVKVTDEESLDLEGENCQARIEDKAADTSKTCKRSKKCKGETAKGKGKSKKSKKSSAECTGDDLNDVGSEVSTAGPDAEKDQGHTQDTAVQEETPQHISKRSKRPLPKIPQRKAKKCSVSNAPVEDEDAAPEGQDAKCRETDSEFQVDSLADSQLQKQAVVVLERTPPRLKKTHGWSVSPDQSQTAESPQGSPGRRTRAEKVKRNLSGSERERNEMGKMDECQIVSDPSAEHMTMTALACQDDTLESKQMKADQHTKEDLRIQTEVSTEGNDQMLLKRPVVMVSHEEVHRYLEIHPKATEDNSSASESHLDAVSSKVKSVKEHMDFPVEKSASGVTLEEKVSQYPGMKASASTSPQQCIAQKRRMFTKPTPNLSRSQQAEGKPLNLQTTEYSEDSLHSCPMEDTTTALNKCSASQDELPTSSETLKEDFRDLRVNESNLDDIKTTIDDEFSFTSDEETPTVSKNVVQEILSFLESPDLPTTLSDEDVAECIDPLGLALSETWENKEQITDLEDCDSHSESMTEEPLELTVPARLKKTHGWSVSPDQSQTAESPQGSPGRRTRAEKVKRNLSGSERERNEMGKMDECQIVSDPSAEHMTMTALACQDDTLESKQMKADQHTKEDLRIQTEVSTEGNDQMLLKRPVVMVSHEEVHRYLEIHPKATEDNSSASESHLDAVSSKVKSVKEHMDFPVEKSASGVTLEEKVSQYPGMKASASTSPQQCIAQKRRMFTKPTPNLSRSQQAEGKTLNLQTTEYSEDSLHSCPMEDTTTALNKCSASPDELPTSSETLKEDFRDLRVNESNLDDIKTTIDDEFSFTSDEETPTESKNVVQEILSFLESPDLPTTLSDEDVAECIDPLGLALSETWENKEQITDLEDCDSHSESMTEEPLELTVPASCFKQSTEGSQQNTELHEDSASDIYDVGGHQSHVEAMHCELDLSMKKNITIEDNLVSYEANCKQAQDTLSPVQILGPRQTPTVPLKDTFTDNKETSDPILTDGLIAPPDTRSQVSTEALGASFSEATTKYPSNTCDMNTMLFCETTTEDSQRSVSFCEENVCSMEKIQHSISDSVEEDKAENLLKAPEDCSGNAKSDILDSAGAETEEEPTFILTLYEIPTSQLFQEASCSDQEILTYELQPAEVHTPHLSSSVSQFLPSTFEDSSCSALLQVKSQETEKPCKSVSGKVEDDSSVLEDAVKNSSTQQITSEKRFFDDEGSQEVLSYNDSVPTDVTSVLKLGEKPLESTERKAPSQRRSKIKVKPNLRPSKSECASSPKHTENINLPTSCDIAQHTETESKQKTSIQERIGSFVPNILSNPEESGRQPHHKGPMIASVPVSEDVQDEVPMSWGSPVKTDLQMDMDTAVDLSVRHFSNVPDLHSTAIEQTEEEVEDGCEGVSRVVLVDALVVASGEMEDQNRLQGDSDCSETSLTFNDRETFSELSEELYTHEEALNLTSTSQDRTEQSESILQVRPEIDPETNCNKDESSILEYLDIMSNQPAIKQITLEPQIKKESDKGKEKAKQEEFSENTKEDLGTSLNLTEEVLNQEQQLAQLASTCAETQSVEKTEDVSHVVLSDMFVAVSEENKDEVHMDSESSLLHISQLCEDPCAVEKEPNLTKDADQELGEHEAVSHSVMADIFVPVSEEVEDVLGKEQMTTRKRSPHKAESSQVKEHPRTRHVQNATNMGPSLSPKRRMPSKKGLLKVKMSFPKRRKRESTASVAKSAPSSAEPQSTSTLREQDICTLKSKKESNSEEIEGSSHFESETIQTLWQKTQCGVKTTSCAKSPSTDSTDIEDACEGVSHTVFSDIFVPVSDETTESSLHKDALMVEEFCNERPTNTERRDFSESQSSEHNTASCRRVSQTAETLEHQAEEEWFFRSNILPIDSNEIENWCEGVSHMLLSDAFVPVSEEENSTDQKDVENAKSLPEYGRTSDNGNDEHQVDSISGIHKTVERKMKEKLPQSQSKTSSERQSSLQMTLRSPGRSPKNQPYLLSSTQAVPTTPQRAKTSKEKKESIQTPTRLQGEEMIRECRIPLARLSLEEICQHDLQPTHHSTPVNVKFLSKGNDSGIIGLESHAAQEPTMPSDDWPKVLLNRINIMATDADTSTSTSSPPRVSTTAYRPLNDYQSPQGSPHNSGLNAGDEPASVSQFFFDNVFTEVVDPD